jgi:hypothetical protein
MDQLRLGTSSLLGSKGSALSVMEPIPEAARVPREPKTWAQFNTAYALAHPGARLADFAAAWEAHVAEGARCKKPTRSRKAQTAK